MVTAEMNSSTIKQPFLVFTGTKMENAKRPYQTNDFKYSTRREDGLGFLCVNHQEKHWFDGIITIRYLKFLCYEVYPGKKVGLIWDHAPQHVSAKVQRVIDQLCEEGCLVLMLILKGLTSVMQVCDLVGNKSLKQFIKNKYYEWRSEYIAQQRNIIRIGKSIKVKVPTGRMIQFVEAAVDNFNSKQSKNKTIKECFNKSGQNPWNKNNGDLFIQHLNSLKECTHFKRNVDEQMFKNQEHMYICDNNNSVIIN